MILKCLPLKHETKLQKRLQKNRIVLPLNTCKNGKI